MEKQTMNPCADEIVEHFNVSGVLYVTIDNGSVHTLMFNQHVRIHIAFNNEKQIKEQDPLSFVKFESPDIVESIESGEENDVAMDDEMIESDESSSCSNSKHGLIKRPSKDSISIRKAALKEEIIQDRARPVKETKIIHDMELENEKPYAKRGIQSAATQLTNVAESESDGFLYGVSKVPVKHSISEVDELSGETHSKKSKSRKKRKAVDSTSCRKKSMHGSSKIKLKDKIPVLNKSPQFLVKIQDTITDSKQGTSSPLDRKNTSSSSRELQQSYSCMFCSQQFKTQLALKSHHKVFSKEIFHCSKCLSKFKRKAYLMTHEMFYHPDQGTSFEDTNGVKKYICKECGKGIYYKSVRHHMLTHTGEKLHKCCCCSVQVSAGYSRLKMHMQTHVKATSKVECKKCHIFFHTRAELGAHQLTHSFKCDLCDAMFPSKTGRYFHYETAHKHDILKCSICGKLFSSEKDLEVHITHHRHKRPQQCPFCGGLFVFLKQHIRRLHCDEAVGETRILFMCDKCPKEFKCKKKFTDHMNVHHFDGPKDSQIMYSCHICEKQYPTSGGLRRHLLTHSEEKPFVCKVCGKACNQAGNLKTHMKVHNKSSSAGLHCC